MSPSEKEAAIRDEIRSVYWSLGDNSVQHSRQQGYKEETVIKRMLRATTQQAVLDWWTAETRDYPVGATLSYAEAREAVKKLYRDEIDRQRDFARSDRNRLLSR